MFRRTIVAVGLVVLAGCAVGERPTLTDEGLEGGATAIDGGAVGATGADDDTTSSTAVATTEADDGVVLGDPGDAPAVLTSATGVVVPVIARAEAGYRVVTPCGVETEIAWGQPLGPVDVVLDPGHGGDEDGAIGPSGETEAEVNLDVARRTAAILEELGYLAALTRTGDYRIPIPNRAAIADRLDAAALVSIHHNSPTPELTDNRPGPGTEVYVQSASEESRRLGGLVYDEAVAALSVFDAEWASRTDAGVLAVLNDGGEDAYGITRRPLTPSVLVELAYLSNPTEAVVIGTSEYRQAAAEALAGAIDRYLQTADGGTAVADEPRLFNPSGATGGDDGCVDPALE